MREPSSRREDEKVKKALADLGWRVAKWVVDDDGRVQCVLERVGSQRGSERREVESLADVLDPAAPRRQRVVRVMLSHQGRAWKIEEVAREAGVSEATASKVARALVEEALAEYLGRGPGKKLRLLAAGRLLDEWAMLRRLGHKGKLGYFARATSRERLMRELTEAAGDAGCRLGFTLAAGADFYGPYIRDEVVHAHFMGAEREFAEATGLQPAISGANVILYPTRDEGVFYLPERVREELGILGNAAAAPVCPVQLYLDMKAARGRYAEQAEKLREEVIGY